MIQELKLDDSTNQPKFVRVEITPKDNDLFNHNLDNWQMRVDQDFRPDWFDSEKTEEELKEQLKKWFEQRFIIDDNSWQKREGQKIFLRNSSVEAWGNSSVEAWGNSSVVARENSSVVAWGNSSVEAWGNSSVEAWGNSSVVARENSSVVARENSSVEAWGNSSVVIPYSKDIKIINISDNATVKDLSGNKSVIYIADDRFEIKKFKN